MIDLSHGGFGLSSASRVSPCAFLGSWAASLAFLPGCIEKFPSAPTNIDTTPSERFLGGYIFRAIIGLHPVGEDIKSLIPNAEHLPNSKPKLQAKLTQILQSEAAKRLISRSDQRSQARLRSASGSESAAWLDALPSSNALSYSPAEFRIAALLRLGAEIPFLRDIDHCDCGAAIDNDGYHTLTCARGSGAVRRHNAIQHTWINLLHSVNYVCDLEREHQFDDDNKRPDIGVFNFKDGRKLLWMSASFTRNLDRFSREVPVQTVPRRLKKMRISWPNTSTTQRDSDTSSSRLFSRCLADGVPSQSVSSPNFPFALLWIFLTTKMHSWIFGVNVCLSLFNVRILVSFYVKLSLFSHLFLFPLCPPQLELPFGASAGSNCVLCSFYSCSLVFVFSICLNKKRGGPYATWPKNVSLFRGVG